MYYTNEDLEQFYIRYKAEGVPAGETMQGFCSRNKVPYNIFLKWYKDTHRKIVPVQIDGCPQDQEPVPATPPVEPRRETPQDTKGEPALRISVDIRVSNGLSIRQRNISPADLQRLAANLMNLC